MVLTINELTKRFGNITAVNGISFDIERGQVFGILGPNGSGKSTTLGMLLGVIRPDSGHYSWFGEGQVGKHRRCLGALLEKPNFCPWLSGRQNLNITGYITGVEHLEQSVQSSLQKVGLWADRFKPFSSYSLGMKQRLAIAAALLGSPEVLVLDEPTNGVDAEGIIEIRETIKELAQEGKTIVLASHILDEVEKVCSHVGIMKQGNVLQSGAISEVLTVEDTVEVGARDLSLLSEALKDCNLLRDFEVRDGLCLVHLHDDKPLEDLNRFLLEKGVLVNHLVQKKKSLETHFLELLGNEK
ncbi:MAG: ABC transporter ATP-binding protein [Oligoflexales bacterium]|nr:ABC transporter ATP-binding protein [Oligoflexales bacterium]